MPKCAIDKKIFSVPIHRIDILGQRLLIMAGFTKTLPVGPVPEQLLVSTMGCDVVNHSGFRVPALLYTLGAQRMGLKELLGFPLPSAAVAAPPRRTGRLWMERQVFLTVLLARFHQGRASRLFTRYFWSVGHLILSLLDIRKAGWIFHHLGSVIGIFSPQILASSSDGVNAITLLFEKSLTFLVMI